MTIIGINIEVIGGVESDTHNRIDSAVGLIARAIEPVFEVIVVARESNRAVTKAKNSRYRGVDQRCALHIKIAVF